MGGTLVACGPNQSTSDAWDSPDCAMVYYRYSGFTDFKVVVLQGTIDFLVALSGKQISKKLLVDEGIVTSEAVEGEEEVVVIANYRARIDAAISLLKSWQRVPIPEPSSMNSLFGYNAIAAILASVPLAFDVIQASPAAPHTLVELRLAGIHALLVLYDSDGSMPYEQAKDTAWLLRIVKPHCKWGETWDYPEGEPHFIDQMLEVFEAVPPGGTART
ncbi:hypothetical protein DFH06DRAFT_1465279 [Mycena polygramma]|nr:hypothetical protein DFH06DRAFT_1465279 [Mycena polygramma]